jgi:hypothetical protein
VMYPPLTMNLEEVRLHIKRCVVAFFFFIQPLHHFRQHSELFASVY